MSFTVFLGSSELHSLSPSSSWFSVHWLQTRSSRVIEEHARIKSLCPIYVEDGYYIAAWKHCFHSRETTWERVWDKQVPAIVLPGVALHAERASKMSPFLLSSKRCQATEHWTCGCVTASPRALSAPVSAWSLCQLGGSLLARLPALHRLSAAADMQIQWCLVGKSAVLRGQICSYSWHFGLKPNSSPYQLTTFAGMLLCFSHSVCSSAHLWEWDNTGLISLISHA